MLFFRAVKVWHPPNLRLIRRDERLCAHYVLLPSFSLIFSVHLFHSVTLHRSFPPSLPLSQVDDSGRKLAAGRPSGTLPDLRERRFVFVCVCVCARARACLSVCLPVVFMNVLACMLVCHCVDPLMGSSRPPDLREAQVSLSVCLSFFFLYLFVC